MLVGVRTDLHFRVKVLEERFADNLQDRPAHVHPGRRADAAPRGILRPERCAAVTGAQLVKVRVLAHRGISTDTRKQFFAGARSSFPPTRHAGDGRSSDGDGRTLYTFGLCSEQEQCAARVPTRPSTDLADLP